jgi:soluble lytic murein transglycosylase-like protein
MSFLATILLAVLGPLYASETAVRAGPVQVAPPPSAPVYNGRCAEWAGAALDAGWTEDQLPELLDRIMWCESKCEPHAHNPSGASGLLQIMPMWHKGRDAFDPDVNLAIGLEVYEAQGWRAWSCA